MLTFNRLIFILILITLISLNLTGASNSKTKFLRFVSEPESTYIELNKKVNLKCLAKPKKGSRIQWLINGEPVKIDDREIFTTADSLTIQLPPRTDQNVGMYKFDELVKSEIQCRAEYKNQGLLSQPAKITVAFLNEFTYSEDEIKVDVKEEQIAVIPCKPPNSPPRVVTSFAFKDKIIESNDEKYHIMPSGNLQIFNVSMEDSGRYQCIAYNPWLKERKNSSNYVTLHVEKRFHNNDDESISQDRFVIEKLNFLTTPKQKYSVIRGTDVQIFECVASSILPVSISWFREDSKPLPKSSKIVGGNLVINNVQTDDQGNYYCEASNGHKTITATSELEVKQSASIIGDLESKQVQLGEQDVQFECSYSGYPTPKISWFLNGVKLISSKLDQLDIRIDQVNDETSRLVIKKVNEKHNGIIQCFASNELSTVYSVAKVDLVNELNNNENTSPIRPINPRRPKPNRNKQSDMAVPNKPKIIRLSSDSVIVHWKMPKQNRLPITFFKIQYKDLHQYNNKTDWITVEDDIPPNINSFSIINLQSDKFYKFRIMAVYNNQDSQDGKVSDRFFLAKNPIYRRPSSIPKVIQGKSDNSNSIEIHWEIKFLDDEQVEGFLIHYRPTQSAEIYHKITIDNNRTTKYLIENLVQSKQYDIKIQTFNQAGVSEFSKIETVRTLSVLVGPDDETSSTGDEDEQDQNLKETKISKEDEHNHVHERGNELDKNRDINDISNPLHPIDHNDQSNTSTVDKLPDNNIDSSSASNSTTTSTESTEIDNLKSGKNINPLSTETALFYVIVAIIILINLIILVYCYSIVRRWINRSKDHKAKCDDDKFDLDDENFILKPVEEDSMSRSFNKMNAFNEPLYSSNGGILSTNPHLTRKAIKNYNHNYATIGHSKMPFNKSDVYDSSLMNVRVNKFCDDSITNSLLAINKASNHHHITKRDLTANRMSTTISHHNLTRPNLVNNSHPHSTIYGNHHTIHNNMPNKNLLLPETNLKAINTLGRHRPTTRNFEELYATNTRFATINRSNSIARLNNGTLERNKRKTRESRNDLFTVLNIKEENEPTAIVDLQQSPNLDFRTLKSVRYVNNNLTANNLNGNALNGTTLNGMTSITNLNYNGTNEGIYNSSNLNNLNNSSLNSNNSNLMTCQTNNHLDNSMNNYEQLVQNSPRPAYSMQQQNLAQNLTPTQLTNNRPIVGMMQSSC